MMYADWFVKIARISNPLLVLLISIFILPEYSLSDSVDCDDYKVPELKSLCNYNNPNQNVYNNVSEKGLNELADSWNNNYLQQLRIIPPGRYILSRPIILQSFNSLAPNPTAPLKNKTLRTIELVASDDFQQASDGFYLIRLEGNSQVGGLEIHGAEQPVTLLDSFHGRNITDPRYCLVRVASNTRTGFVGSVLTGYETLDSLFCNTSFRSSGYYDGTDGLLFQRNYLRTYGARGAIALAASYSDGSLLIENNSIFIDPFSDNQAGEKSSGLYLGKLSPRWEFYRSESGEFLIRHNDFIFPVNSGSSTETRMGIEIGDAKGFQLELNAFVTPLARQLRTKDVAVFDTRAKVSGHRVMGLTGNSFSPHLTPGGANHNGSGETMHVIADDSKQYSYSTFYPFEQPEAFMRYQGNLGNNPVLISLLQSGNSSSNLTLVPREGFPGNLTTISRYLARESAFCPECYVDYPPPFGKGDLRYIPMIIIAVAAVISSAGCGNFARRRAMGRSGCGCR